MMNLDSLTRITAVTMQEVHLDVVRIPLHEDLVFGVSQKEGDTSLFRKGCIVNLWPSVQARPRRQSKAEKIASVKDPLLKAAMSILSQDEQFKQVDRLRKRLGLIPTGGKHKKDAKNNKGDGADGDEEGKNDNAEDGRPPEGGDSDSGGSDEEYEKKILSKLAPKPSAAPRASHDQWVTPGIPGLSYTIASVIPSTRIALAVPIRRLATAKLTEGGTSTL